MLVSSSDDDVLAGWRHFSPLWNPSEHEETRFFFSILIFIFFNFFSGIFCTWKQDHFSFSPLKNFFYLLWVLIHFSTNQLQKTIGYYYCMWWIKFLWKKRRKNPSRPPCLLVKHPFSSKLKIKSENNNFDKLPTLNNFLDLNSSDDLATQYSIKEENWKWSIKFLNIKN